MCPRDTAGETDDGASKRLAAIFLLVLGGTLGHERIGGKGAGSRIDAAFHDDFGTRLEGIGHGALEINPDGLGRLILVHEQKAHAQRVFGPRQVLGGHGAKKPRLAKFRGLHGQRFGDIEKIGTVFSEPGKDKVTESAQKQHQGHEIHRGIFLFRHTESSLFRLPSNPDRHLHPSGPSS